ncbi:hypothetical protein RRG08_014240 [Elysia crispata]|uniref:Uncharacterized protein n=1 Tax=Elysia crispata TaxID=231223 RepID=A0AAE1CF54_9GAST|nr:hypothetical protein RRG08_014240 [Elysia crispata]
METCDHRLPRGCECRMEQEDGRLDERRFPAATSSIQHQRELIPDVKCPPEQISDDPCKWPGRGAQARNRRPPDALVKVSVLRPQHPKSLYCICSVGSVQRGGGDVLIALFSRKYPFIVDIWILLLFEGHLNFFSHVKTRQCRCIALNGNSQNILKRRLGVCVDMDPSHSGATILKRFLSVLTPNKRIDVGFPTFI